MRYKYSELSIEAKMRAVKEYRDDWLESHTDDEFSSEDAEIILKDMNETYRYNCDGYYLGEVERILLDDLSTDRYTKDGTYITKTNTTKEV